MTDKNLILSGLEPLVVSEKSNFINVGERTNVTGSKKFLRLIEEDKFSEPEMKPEMKPEMCPVTCPKNGFQFKSN